MDKRIVGYCWQWKAKGQCSQGDNCSFRHGVNKRAKPTQPTPSPRSPTQQSEKCIENQKTCTTLFFEKWHPPECLFYKSEKGCRFGEKRSHAHRQVDEQPSKRSLQSGDKSEVAMLKITRQLGCVSQDMEPTKSSSILRKSSDILKPIRCVRFTQAVVSHACIRDHNPSLGMICQNDPHQRNPNAPKM